MASALIDRLTLFVGSQGIMKLAVEVGATVHISLSHRAVARVMDVGGVGPLAVAQERLDEIHRQREHDGALFAAELEQGLQVAQLDGSWVAAEDLRGLVDLLSGLELTLSVDDLGATLAFGLGLTSHCS